MKHGLFLFLLFCFLFFVGIFSQRNLKDATIGTPLFGVHYGANQTGGHLAESYGFLNHIGIMTGYKSSKNWCLGLDANYIFGNQIKMRGLFDQLIDSFGNITDVNGDIASVVLYARGVNVNATIGKVFPVLSPNKNSGIFIHSGFGYLFHKLRIETQNQVVPPLELDYKIGYDRLTAGPNFHQFLGYLFMSSSGFLNFYAGCYFQQGITKYKRNIFYDQPGVLVSKASRLDLQYGVKFGWLIPVYKRQPKDFYYD